MTKNAWGFAAFVASVVIAFAYLSDVSDAVFAAAIVISIGSLMLPQRTGPFPFLAWVIVSAAFADAGIMGRMVHPRAAWEPRLSDVVVAALFAFYVLAACEFDALKHGIYARRKSPLETTPPAMPLIVRALAAGILAGVFFVLVRDYAAGRVPFAVRAEVALSAALLWVLLFANVAAGVGMGVLEIRSADRATARRYLEEIFWKAHRPMLRFTARMIWKR